MAKILMIGNQKGGVGKSQVSIMTATALSQKPFHVKTCIIDIDNQKSIIRTRNLDLRAYQVDTVPFEVFNYSISDLQTSIAALDKEYDLIFIDTAGKLDNTQPIETQEITKALMYVDFVFIPFVAGNHILEATTDYFRFINAVQTIRTIQPRTLKAYGFINMHRSRSRANAFLSEDLEHLKESENLVMMQSTLNDYSLFREADTVTSLYDAVSSDSAKQNFTIFLNELLTIIQS